MAAANQLKIVGDGRGIGDEKLRLWLESYIAEHPHLTTTVLARTDHIGGSKTLLDAYINGTYFLPKEQGGMGVKESKIEKKIQAYRDRVEGTVRHGYKNSFIPTRNWLQFQYAFKTAIEENVIVVIYGEPGVGKSRCKLEFSKQRMTTRPIEILCSANITTRYFVQKIARELGLSDSPSTARLEDNIAERLKDNPRPIVVDQANYLHEKALGTCCYLWDVAQIPIILLGTKDLYEIFNTSRLTEDVRRQLSSRIAMNYQLQGLSLDEVKTIVMNALGDRATDAAIKEIYKQTRGNHRHLDMVMPRLTQTIEKNSEALEAGDLSIEELVDTATKKLMVG